MIKFGDLYCFKKHEEIECMIVVVQSVAFKEQKEQSDYVGFILFDLSGIFEEYDELPFVHHNDVTRQELIDKIQLERKECEGDMNWELYYADYSTPLEDTIYVGNTDANYPSSFSMNYQHFILPGINPYFHSDEPGIHIKDTQHFHTILMDLQTKGRLIKEEVTKLKALSVLLPTSFETSSPPSLLL